MGGVLGVQKAGQRTTSRSRTERASVTGTRHGYGCRPCGETGLQIAGGVEERAEGAPQCQPLRGLQRRRWRFRPTGRSRAWRSGPRRDTPPACRMAQQMRAVVGRLDSARRRALPTTPDTECRVIGRRGASRDEHLWHRQRRASAVQIGDDGVADLLRKRQPVRRPCGRCGRSANGMGQLGDRAKPNRASGLPVPAGRIGSSRNRGVAASCAVTRQVPPGTVQCARNEVAGDQLRRGHLVAGRPR